MKTNIFRPKNLFMIFLGNTTMALGIVMFVLPNELMTGEPPDFLLIARSLSASADFCLCVYLQLHHVFTRCADTGI